MKRPRLNNLRAFEAAGRRMSFSLAAAELNISQAAVSQQIRNLEAYLGAQLFVRNHSRVTLSSAGVAYLEAVHEALDRLDTVTDQLFPERFGQSVTISCTSSIATLWLAPKIGAFQTSHPEIDLRIRTLDSDHKSGQQSGADLEIFISVKDASDARTQLLLTAEITPVAAPALVGEMPKAVRPRDILAFEMIHVTGYDDDWHKWFRTHGLTDVTVPRGLTLDGSLIALETTLHGDGIVLGRRPFIDSYLQSGQLVEVFEEKFTLTANYYLRKILPQSGRRPVTEVERWLLNMADSL